MEVSAFDYPLPAGAIAQAPAPSRDASRLLVIDRTTGALHDRRFTDLQELLEPGDCVVVNDSRVIPARVLGEDARQRAIEMLFLEPIGEGRWRMLVRPGRRCPAGAVLAVGGERGARIRVLAVEAGGTRVVERADGPVSTVEDLLDTYGMLPLPPYIGRHLKPDPADDERYQTVYGRRPGSVAAPTAGLHVSEAVLARLAARGIEVHALTLHVGAATFQPIRTPDVQALTLPAERVTISEATALAATRARRERRRVVAVGTTTTRALEGTAREDGTVAPFDGRVDLAIVPGYRFRVVDALVSNFHLPRSSLLVLVSAFAGREVVLRAYRHALAAGYRFYSYGDATLIV